MKPLAYRLRPKTLKQIYGQDHLVGEKGIIKKLLDRNSFISFILHGNPGTGKTSIAIITAEMTKMDYYHFNASTDNKATLKTIIDQTAYRDVLIIVDEIHRMKADIQDYLLPYIESGSIKIIGITTENPYAAVNPAIRSRCHIYAVNDIGSEDILKALKNALNSEEISYDGIVDKNVLEYIANTSNLDLRSALNKLEIVLIYADDQDQITLPIAKMALGDKSLAFGVQDYYDILSAFQKSIRGSDVDASLHYLARLITFGDLTSIIRRLQVIVYEDVGLANPILGAKVHAACETALKLGLPEGRIPLAVAVIDTALSPKSNTAITAIDKAINVFKTVDVGPIPNHILNREIAKNSSLYKYPHNYPNSYIKQEYLPKKIKNHTYYEPKLESNYEIALQKRLEALKKS